MPNNPKLAVIGAGNIASFHVPALREAGFEVNSIAASPQSKNVKHFADEYKIPRIYEMPSQLLESHREWDALLICSSVESTLRYLKSAIELGVPTLVEKPVSKNPKDLLSMVGGDYKVIVGYNRRFYKMVHEARDFVNSGAPVIATLTIPELIETPKRLADSPDYMSAFFTNSVHGLDLARFVLGDITLKDVQHLRNDSGLCLGIVATFTSKNGNVLQFCGNWSAPANFGLILDRQGARFSLSPFENAIIFDGIDVIEPTAETPLRRYMPRPVKITELDGDDLCFKPGFVAQVRALMDLVRGVRSKTAATLDDAYAVLGIVESLVEFP